MMITKMANRARIHDALALLVTIVVIALDQGTKSLVVTYLSPPGSRSLSLIGHYLTLYYVQNRGAAFSMFTNTTVLVIFIAVALIAVGYIYFRLVNSGPWYYKVAFGLIIGGALGNVINRIDDGGSVVDFIAFRIPQISFRFAIFNVADACISLGVILFFVFVLLTRPSHDEQRTETTSKNNSSQAFEK